MEKKTKTIIGSILIILLGFGAWKFTKDTDDKVIPLPEKSTFISKNGYKDGVYTQTGSYISPAGPENVDVTVTLKNNIITDATFVSKATNQASKFNQSNFSAGFKEQVIGKNINEIALTVVNGASLTPRGFNDAIEKIKTAAAIN